MNWISQFNSLFKLGFGFVEVGTITPKRQLGNPKPRIFRLEKDEALINRLGFNNHGSKIVAQRISDNKPQGVLGINIGPNKETKNKSESIPIIWISASILCSVSAAPTRFVVMSIVFSNWFISL